MTQPFTPPAAADAPRHDAAQRGRCHAQNLRALGPGLQRLPRPLAGRPTLEDVRDYQLHLSPAGSRPAASPRSRVPCASSNPFPTRRDRKRQRSSGGAGFGHGGRRPASGVAYFGLTSDGSLICR